VRAVIDGGFAVEIVNWESFAPRVVGGERRTKLGAFLVRRLDSARGPTYLCRLTTETAPGTKKRGSVVTDKLKKQLINYIEDAHALEQHVARELDVMIDTTQDEEMLEHLRQHKDETERHERLLRERLEAHGTAPSRVKDAGAIFSALGKGLIDKARRDNAGRNARDGYVAEHMEIASYELLERVARRAGDEDTAHVAERNRADEEAMAQKIASSWDRVVELSLREEGVAV
jgi:ferritin-like metal-binding protein YciE